VERSIRELGAIAELGRRIQGGGATLEDAVEAAPYPSDAARASIERALAQLRGELDDRVSA
jgi:hypothetical protein